MDAKWYRLQSPKTPSSAVTVFAFYPFNRFFRFSEPHQDIRILPHLVEEANDLAGNVLSTGLLVVHDTSGGGEDDVAELTGREQLDNPLLELRETDVVAGRDDTSLVETVRAVSIKVLVFVWWEVRRTGRSAERQSCRSGGRRPPRTRQCSLRREKLVTSFAVAATLA